MSDPNAPKSACPTFKLGEFLPFDEDHFPLSTTDQKVLDDFHNLYFRLNEKKPGLLLSWLGYQTGKLPGDLWIYQELIFRLRPEVIIECGTHKGGSALFLSHICEIVGSGKVVSIDLYRRDGRPIHKLLSYFIGSSTDQSVYDSVKKEIGCQSKVLVILDSDHTKEHVSRELALYSPLVPVGGYIVVEDSFLNGHPSHVTFGSGPMEAIEEFIANNRNFVIDRSLEKFLFTLNRKGFLKRIK